MGAYGSISTGYDPGYLLRESSKGAEGYYLSAVAEIGEPPGVWTGRACAALGLPAGAEVKPAVMEAVYGRLLDPRDPQFAGAAVRMRTRRGSGPRRAGTGARTSGSPSCWTGSRTRIRSGQASWRCRRARKPAAR